MKGGENNAVALEVEDLAKEQRDAEIQELQSEISEVEKGVTSKSSIVFRLATEPSQNVIQYLAKKYNRLYELHASEIPTNEIANYLTEKLKGFVAKSTVYDALDSKFKSHTPNPITEEEESNAVRNRTESSSLNTDIEQNNFYADKLKHAREVLHLYENILREPKPFFSKLSKDQQNKFTEQIHLMDFLALVYEQLADNRESIPADFQFILFTEITKHTLNEVGANYIKSVRNFGAARVAEKDAKTDALLDLAEETVTSKQVTKTMEGRVPKVLKLYDPQSRDEALFAGYHGTQCPNCLSWRTVLHMEGPGLKCKCYECDAKFERGMISKCRNCSRPFYEATLHMMIKNSTEIINKEQLKTTCPYENCGVEITLPIKLLVPFVKYVRK